MMAKLSTTGALNRMANRFTKKPLSKCSDFDYNKQMDFCKQGGAFHEQTAENHPAGAGRPCCAGGGYLAYVLIDYHRLGDMDLEVDRQVLQPPKPAGNITCCPITSASAPYEPDYGFFMDGGTESWAWSQEWLTDNIGNIGRSWSQQHADFYLIQEVDRDSTRSYHVDEAALLREALPEYDGTWAQNYDSPFLMYPLRHPHGASVSGLMTLSAMTVDSARRVELPIENSLMKLVDLDRCYSVHRIPVARRR